MIPYLGLDCGISLARNVWRYMQCGKTSKWPNISCRRKLLLPFHRISNANAAIKRGSSRQAIIHCFFNQLMLNIFVAAAHARTVHSTRFHFYTYSGYRGANPRRVIAAARVMIAAISASLAFEVTFAISVIRHVRQQYLLYARKYRSDVPMALFICSFRAERCILISNRHSCLNVSFRE
jgi:hypothetical protein